MNVASVKPSDDPLDRQLVPLGHGEHGHHADQGKQPEGAQQQIVAHGAVTGSVIKEWRVGRPALECLGMITALSLYSRGRPPRSFASGLKAMPCQRWLSR